MRPVAMPQFVRQHHQPKEKLIKNLEDIHTRIKKLSFLTPDVSVIIPAYNEEESILQTLSSLSAASTKKRVEIIVVDNNSADATRELAVAAGATCIEEKTQGITPARNAGLKAAKGKLILNADADTIYPPDWIDLMVQPLSDESIVLVYGSFAFIPTRGTSRWIYFGYEYISDFSKWINKKFREEAVNVYGFNSAFRKEEGVKVHGFDHPPGANEDGWLGLKLRDSFRKRLYHVTHPKAIVWTTDRRLQFDGGIYQAFVKRVKRHLSR